MFDGFLKSAVGGLGLLCFFVFILWVYFVNFTSAGKGYFFNKHLLFMRQLAKRLVDYVMGLSRYIGYKGGTIIAIIFVLLINTVLIKGLGLKPNVPFYPQGVAGDSFLIMVIGSLLGVILLWGQIALLYSFLTFRIKQKNEVVEAIGCITYPLSKLPYQWANIAVGLAVIFVGLCGLFLLNGIPENIANEWPLLIKGLLLSVINIVINILLIIKNLIIFFIILSFVAIFTKRLDYIVITNEWVSTISFAIFPVKLRVLVFDFSPIIALWLCGIVHSILTVVLTGLIK